jgi:hypothetical protein
MFDRRERIYAELGVPPETEDPLERWRRLKPEPEPEPRPRKLDVPPLTFDDVDAGEYRCLDVVALNGGSFVALRDAPGRCPGSGWQLLTSPGKRGAAGQSGEKGERGERGPSGNPGLSGATISGWKVDRARYVATPLMSDGAEGPPLELRGLFEQFWTDAR